MIEKAGNSLTYRKHDLYGQWFLALLRENRT